MGRNKYIDEGGVENIACALVDNAKKDFIRGGKIVYGLLKRIPTHSELYKIPGAKSLWTDRDVRWMYDAWRFVSEDPYQFFGDVGEEIIIKTWSEEAIKEYYKVLYLRGATMLYKQHVRKKFPNEKIQNIPNEEIISVMNDSKLSSDFITARDYISKTNEADKIFHEWNVVSFSRARRMYLGRQRTDKTDYIDNRSTKRKENIAKTI